MSTGLLAALAVVALVAGAIWAAKRWGAAAALRDIEHKRAEVRDEQLQATVDAPRDAGDLVERLRRGGF